MKIHLIEGAENRPREGEMVRTKCGAELAFRPFAPSLGKLTKICSDCDSGPTKIPNFLAVAEIMKQVGA
ncbi:MAG TPA: hypothetical protein VJH05_02380 [Candidatus Paceibacterota bacterium]